MNATALCQACGEPVEGLLLRARDGSCYHHDSVACIAALRDALQKARAEVDALKAALESAEADRDRYRGVLVALRDADRAFVAATQRKADPTLSPADDASRLADPAVRKRLDDWHDEITAADAAYGRALAAAIAAVEEETK